MISIVIVLAGLAAMRALPIAQYPEIAPPVVQVTASYPGASAEVLEQTVAAPIENAITGVEGMMYMSSTSSSAGATTLEVTCELGTDVDQAAVDVNNRVKQVEARLPEETRRQGVVKARRALQVRVLPPMSLAHHCGRRTMSPLTFSIVLNASLALPMYKYWR